MSYYKNIDIIYVLVKFEIFGTGLRDKQLPISIMGPSKDLQLHFILSTFCPDGQYRLIFSWRNLNVVKYSVNRGISYCLLVPGEKVLIRKRCPICRSLALLFLLRYISVSICNSLTNFSFLSSRTSSFSKKV